MDLDRIKALIDAMAASSLDELELSEAGWTLRLVRRGDAGDRPAALQATTAPAGPALPDDVPAPAVPPVPPPREASAAVAPLYGVVYLRPGPDSPDFVQPGTAVTRGAPLCVIEAMKVFHEVRAERDGTVAAILVASGQEVEAGQELVRFG